MRETIKGLCVLGVMAAVVATVILCTDPRPTNTVRAMRVVCPCLGVVMLGVFLKLHNRPDIAADHLRRAMGSYFNRGGFCFAFKPTTVDGTFYLLTYFQNQAERPCHASIALRPARGFWLGRPPIETVIQEIDCGPAAFGIAKVAIPLPESVQGKLQLFEVGASVVYPAGKGRRLRFYDGFALRTDANFRDRFRAGLMLAGALAGRIVASRPQTVTFDLPSGVAEEIPEGADSGAVTLWQLGDPPLEHVGG